MKVFKSLLSTLVFSSSLFAIEEIPQIERRIPPKGIELSQEVTQTIQADLKKLEQALAQLHHPLRADAEVFYKSVQFALNHGEFYAKQGHLKMAKAQIAEGLKRVELLKQNKSPWTTQKGLVVRGYHSPVDGSVQPLILEVPENLNLKEPHQLWIWLHGRGEKVTDFNFIHKASNGKRKLPSVQKGIVVHPLGRQCIGWKSAGQFDILHALDFMKQHYNIDEDRVALLGFSMGGAGAWQAGAHFTENWVALHAGAGFAETAEFLNLSKKEYPPWYEQTLWQLYDVPHYVRNLFNIPVISYSGGIDKQIQAARVMEKAFAKYGKTLNHLVAPNTAHKYAPGYLEKVVTFIEKAMEEGRQTHPKSIQFQTQTLRYPSFHWVNVHGLDQHWVDSRVDANLMAQNHLNVQTQNIRELVLDSPIKDRSFFPKDFNLSIDGQELRLPEKTDSLKVSKKKGQWRWVKNFGNKLKKTPGLQGPMDDAFNEAFLVVAPSSISPNLMVQRWVDFELQRLKKRWSQVFRGYLPLKLDTEVTADDIANKHLILWGDPRSNQLISKVLDQLPMHWDESHLSIRSQKYDATQHIPMMGYPNPLNPKKYVVFNTGPTFREDDDANNSKQNPKFPDWAIVNLNTLPDKFAPGKVVDADFFDEDWNLR